MNLISGRRIVVSAVMLAATIGLAAPVLAQTAAPRRGGEQLLSVAARIEAINQTTREVTLKGPAGNVVTFTVDKRVTRLGEMKVGDDVVADYYVSWVAELRAPTADEKLKPLTVLTETAKAPADAQPAAGALRIIKAVVTVEGLDRPTKSLTVSGPSGNVTVQVADVAALSKLRLGDSLVVTYTEAIAVGIEKRAPKK